MRALRFRRWLLATEAGVPDDNDSTEIKTHVWHHGNRTGGGAFPNQTNDPANPFGGPGSDIFGERPDKTPPPRSPTNDYHGDDAFLRRVFAEVKKIDPFHRYSDGREIEPFMGTPNFVSPEMARRGITPSPNTPQGYVHEDPASPTDPGMSQHGAGQPGLVHTDDILESAAFDLQRVWPSQTARFQQVSQAWRAFKYAVYRRTGVMESRRYHEAINAIFHRLLTRMMTTTNEVANNLRALFGSAGPAYNDLRTLWETFDQLWQPFAADLAAFLHDNPRDWD